MKLVLTALLFSVTPLAIDLDEIISTVTLGTNTDVLKTKCSTPSEQGGTVIDPL